MKGDLTVLAVGRSRQILADIEGMLRGQPGIEVSVRHAVNGHTDPLNGISQLPNILILDLSHLWEDELKALSIRSGSERPAIIAVGSEGNTQMMRMAMQAGARDFFTNPVPSAELLASLRQIGKELSLKNKTTKKAPLTAIINAKGGSGASFLACNLAHAMAVHIPLKVALVDMDLQFGTLPLYLDLTSRDSLINALETADQLDQVALEGYMLKHSSGLHVLGSMTEQMSLPWEMSTKSLNRLLDVALKTYDHVVIDLPRQIDPLNTTVLERADNVLVIMQQTLTHIRDAKRILRVLTRDLSLPNEYIHVIVNRYDDKNPISIRNIREATRIESLLLIPNDYKRVSESINLGIPLFDHARSASITKAIINIAIKLGGQLPAKKGFLKGMFAQVLGR